MKNNDLDRLIKIQEALNNAINNKINTLKINDLIAEDKDFTFPMSKHIFSNLVTKLYETKNGKSLIRQYINEVRKSVSLKNAYFITESVSNPNGIRNTQVFTDEAVKALQGIDADTYLAESKKVSDIVKKCIKECGLSYEQANDLINGSKTGINESIEYFITAKNTNKDLVAHSNMINEVISFVNEHNVINEEASSEKMSYKEAMEAYNNILGDIKESWERECVERIMLCNISGENKKNLFEEYKREAISLIDEGIKDANIENKNELNEIKSQLLKKEFNPACANEDIMTLSELKYTLSE